MSSVREGSGPERSTTAPLTSPACILTSPSRSAPDSDFIFSKGTLNQVRLSNPRPTMWHACDRTAASACPLLSHPSQPSQAAAVRSSYLWHACDRTAAPACPLRVAEPLSPHGRGRVRPYDLAREVRGRVRPYDLCVVRLRPHCVASLLPLLLLIATQLIPRGLRPCAITNLVARP